MARTFVAASSQYVSDGLSPVSDAPVTVACWIKAASTQSFPSILGLGNSGGVTYYMLGAGASNNILQAWQQGTITSDVANATAAFTNGVWSHACGVFASNSDRRVYLNGGNKGTNTTACGTVTPDRFSVGALLRNIASGYFDGAIAEVGVWNIALTDADVASLALGLSPLLVRPDALKRYVPLLAGLSPEPDLMAGRTLTLSGTPTLTSHPRIIYAAGQQRSIEPVLANTPGAGRMFGVF